MQSTIRRLLRQGYYAMTLSSVAKDVQRRNLTYLSPAKLLSLQAHVRSIKRRKVQGNIVELGVALGGSGILLASELDGDRTFHGYDLFGTIPPPDENDERDSHERYRIIQSGEARGIGGDQYYGYVEDLYETVKRTFSQFNVAIDGDRINLHKGLFEDTLVFDDDFRVAFAHIDCDWYSPVTFCLKTLYPHLEAGAIVILDDYNDYAGCRKAAVEFLKGHDDVVLLRTKPSAVLMKVDRVSLRQ